MADNKEKKQTLAQQLDTIAAKNSQIISVRNMQEDKEKLKDKIGRKDSISLSQSRIQGLASLKNTLGRQNMPELSEY